MDKNDLMKTVKMIVIAALCVAILLIPALAETTREAVIALEGMEEPIVETLYTAPAGYSFWYVGELFEVLPPAEDAPEDLVVSSRYSDDCMTLTALTEDEARALVEAYAAESGEDAAQLLSEPLTQIEIFWREEGTSYVFRTLIVANGRYVLADGQYAREAAEGNAKYFQRLVDTVSFEAPEAE